MAKRVEAKASLPSPRKSPRPPKRAAERIRESARDLFYRQGIRAVGVDEIVSHAGVTKPSLYRSFPSKDELAADYLRHMGEDGLARFDATIAADPSDPRGQLRVWLTRASGEVRQARLSRLRHHQRGGRISRPQASRAQGRQRHQGPLPCAPDRARDAHGRAKARSAGRRAAASVRGRLCVGTIVRRRRSGARRHRGGGCA